MNFDAQYKPVDPTTLSVSVDVSSNKANDSQSTGQSIAALSLDKSFTPQVAEGIVKSALQKGYWDMDPAKQIAYTRVLGVIDQAELKGGGSATPAAPAGTTKAEALVATINSLDGSAVEGLGKQAFDALNSLIPAGATLSASAMKAIQGSLGLLKDGKIDLSTFASVAGEAVADDASAKQAGGSGDLAKSLAAKLAKPDNLSVAEIDNITARLATMFGVAPPPELQTTTTGDGTTVSTGATVGGSNGAGSKSPVGTTSTDSNGTKLTQISDAIQMFSHTDGSTGLLISGQFANSANIVSTIQEMISLGYAKSYGLNSAGDLVVNLAGGAKGASGASLISQVVRTEVAIDNTDSLAAKGNVNSANSSWPASYAQYGHA